MDESKKNKKIKKPPRVWWFLETKRPERKKGTSLSSYKYTQFPFPNPKAESQSPNLQNSLLSNGGRAHHRILFSHPPLPLPLPLPHHLRRHPSAAPHRIGLQLDPRPLLLQIGPPEPDRQCVLVRAVVGEKIAVVVAEVPPAGPEVPPVEVVADGGGGEGPGGLPAAGGTEHRLLDDVVPDGEYDEQDAAGDEGGRRSEFAECDIDESADLLGWA